MPRFVLLYHDCPAGFPRPSHWDLMLEAGDVLRTWAVAQLPRDWQSLVEPTEVPQQVAGTNTVEAELLGDHRPAYLDFEGPLSGDRGTVTRVEAGTFVLEHESPERWDVRIVGRVLRGRIRLSRQAFGSARWQLAYQSEETAS